MLENWREIFSVIKKNKLRTFLTGFSISWGIFMFCILLTFGNGLKNGVTSNFADRSINSFQFWGRRTSMPYKGFPGHRRIDLNQNDLDLVKNQVSQVEYVSGMLYSYGISASYNTYNTDCQIIGVSPEHATINGLKFKENNGRFISNADMKEKRKVAVINTRFKQVLFKDDDPIGKQFIANGLGYTVIGVIEGGSERNNIYAYIPFTTAQTLYSNLDIDYIVFTVNGLDTKEKNEIFEKRLREKLAALHIYDPKDERAIGIWSTGESYLQTMSIFNGISAFIWIIGLGTLIAGVISVSNIMLITVRERTREFGIRKALGAKPSSILVSILMESAVVTFLFGYIGMFLGVGFGELFTYVLESTDLGVFKNPTIEVSVAAGALFILIISGIIAGYYPALKAVKISAIEAMREE